MKSVGVPKGHVFISYVREDLSHVDRLCRVLDEAGVAVWRDTAELWPGQEWRARIREAIRGNALVFLACFSRQGVSRVRSYQNEELALAVDEMRLRAPGRVWLIPVRFDECQIPDREIGGGRTLADLHRADLFGDGYEAGTSRLVTAIWQVLGSSAGRRAGDVVAAAVAADFKSDLLALLGRVDEDAVRRGVPERLVPGGDVLRMSRSVRLLAGVRQSQDPDVLGRGMGSGGGDRVYSLAGEGDRACREPPQPWEQFAAVNDRVVVLGDPGMGKSWLIRAETHRLAEAAQRHLAGGAGTAGQLLIPLPVRAGVLAGLEGRTLAEAVTGFLVSLGWLAGRSSHRMQELIDGGGVVLLVDALDEIPVRDLGASSRRRLAGLLRRWAEDCTGTASCIVTSRLAGYAGPPVPGAREAELLPFSREDVRAAAGAWNLPARSAGQLEKWLAQPAIAAMARIPLLLALICSLAANPDRQEQLPQTRAGLYGMVLWQFLSGPHRSGSPDNAPDPAGEADKQALLAVLGHVAFVFATAARGWSDQMPYHDLIRAIRSAGDALTDLGDSPVTILDRLVSQAGLLIPVGNPASAEQDYLFLHRTIAEYLVARHLARLPATDRMRVVTDHQWFDPDWTEVIPMLGGLLAARSLPDARDLVTHFLTKKPDPLHRAFLTAVRITCEARDPDSLLTPATRQMLYFGILCLFRRRFSRERLAALLSAAPTWGRVVTSAILLLDTNEDYATSRSAKSVLTRDHRQYDRYRDIQVLARSKDAQVRRAVRDVLAGGEGSDLAAALSVLTSSSDSRERESTGRVLAGQDGPEVAGALLTLAADSDGDVGEAAVDALNGHEEAAVTQALLTLAAGGKPEVRRAAILQLSGREGAHVTSALLSLAKSHQPAMRSATARALGGRTGTEVTAALLALAADSKTDVRVYAAEALAGRNGTDVTQALIRLTSRGHPSFLRSTATSQLSGRDGADVTTALLTLARSRQPYVRSAAAHALAGRDGTEVTAALLTLAADHEANVREKAAQALAGRDGADVTFALVTLAEDLHYGVHSAAEKALAGRDGPEVTSALLTLARGRFLGDITAARTLAGREGDEATSALIRMATSGGHWGRINAAKGLAGRDGTNITSALLTLTTAKHEEVREAGAEALAGREGSEVTSALLALTADRHPDVRIAAAKALARRNDPFILQRLCRLSPAWILPTRREKICELADQMADQLYVLLPPEKRQRILLRLTILSI